MAHATDQARVAAATLLGHDTAYASVPWFWSDQGDLRLQIAGLTHGADQLVVRGDLGQSASRCLATATGCSSPSSPSGEPADYLAVKRALEKGMTIPADSAADPSVPLKRLITRARDTRSP